MANSSQELLASAERISVALAELKAQIQLLESSGEVAPDGCYVLRYQARGKQGTYWYYKLHATTPTFPTKSGKKSKYKHLGKAGSDAHIEALMQVTRRTQIEILKRTIAA
ncbi:transposase, partial [Floridanema evergladense]